MLQVLRFQSGTRPTTVAGVTRGMNVVGYPRDTGIDETVLSHADGGCK
jgi:hypothetical protein